MTRGPQTPHDTFRIVHELPKRLRFKSKLLWDPMLDVDYLSALLESIPKVTDVRVNIPACCVIVEHEGDLGVKEEVIALMQRLPNEAFLPSPYRANAPDMMEVAALGTFAAATPLLPEPVKASLSWLLAFPSFLVGLETLGTRGLKIEVLDATVKLFSLMRKDYFTANSVGALLALGEYLEHSTEKKTNDLLKNLLQPQVETVTVERDGSETVIPFADVLLGDIVVCGAGQIVPVDGRVDSGEADVNMSSITGESVPVLFKTGDDIQSGGVVEDGKLKILADRVGSDTNMARIGGYIEKSLRNKSPKQQSSEETADKLVPVTFAAGLALYALTGDMARAASVLTVDYSCAIKLSTPVAVRSAMFAAGREGVILKGAQALDAYALVDTMVFDKTGTLTRGQLRLTDVIPMQNVKRPLDEDALLALAAGAEEHYAHPVAKAVVQEARDKGLDLPRISQVDFIVAHGVSAVVDGAEVLVGSRHFIHDDEHIDCSAADEDSNRLHDAGKSLLYVARSGELLGLIGMRDELRPEAAETLRTLKELGVTKLVMLTGDHHRMAKAIKDQLPELDDVHAELAPEDKAGIIERIRAENRKVAFVGDGVNDAPALITADVGVCMPDGADLARETAQVLLIKDDIRGLAKAKRIALNVNDALHDCIKASVGINSALLLLAGAGLIPAIASAAAHNASTIGILGYAAMRGGASPDPQLSLSEQTAPALGAAEEESAC